MKRLVGVLIICVACTAVVTPTTTTTTTVELIPSSTVMASTTVASSTTEIHPSTTSPVVTVVTIAPPVVTAVATTSPPTTRPPTIPTSPPITIAPDVAVVYSAPSEALLTASTDLVRTSIGLPALISHPDLDFYARVWAGKMAIVEALSHSNINSLLGPWLIIGENVAVGPDMSQIAAALAASPDHYAVMTNPAFLHSGIGVAVDGNGRLWVVQVFGGTVLP